MKTIVVGVAHESMGEVLRSVTERALADDARLLVVHAYRDLAQVWLSGDALSAVRPERRRSDARLAIAVAELRDRGVDAEDLVRVGRPAAVLVSVAREHEAEVIIIGSGRKARRRLGGVARALGRVAPCPVLVVPHGVSDGSPPSRPPKLAHVGDA